MIQTDDVILFQGDSITDNGRTRESTNPNDPAGLGGGYARFAAAQLLADHPEKNLRLFNRGVSGNTVGQMEDRWPADCLDLRPNVLSILIGINDTARWINKTPEGRPANEYETSYRRILDAARRHSPDLRVVICEPFALRVDKVTDVWLPELQQRQAIARRIAADYGATWVAFQKLFDDAAREAPPAYWLPDGVHPTPAGHMRMARLWLDAVSG